MSNGVTYIALGGGGGSGTIGGSISFGRLR